MSANLPGTEAAQRLASMFLDRKILYMCGYTDNAMFHQKLLEAGTMFLQRPFSISALEEKVQKALEKPGKAATARA